MHNALSRQLCSRWPMCSRLTVMARALVYASQNNGHLGLEQMELFDGSRGSSPPPLLALSQRSPLPTQPKVTGPIAHWSCDQRLPVCAYTESLGAGGAFLARRAQRALESLRALAFSRFSATLLPLWYVLVCAIELCVLNAVDSFRFLKT